MEYIVVRVNAKVSAKILIENEEVAEGEFVKKIMRYEVLFPAEASKALEKELRLIVKRVKDKLKRLAPLKIANLDLFSTAQEKAIIEILEEGKTQYWEKLKQFAQQFNTDMERLMTTMYFRYNVFKVFLPDGLVRISAIETVVDEIKGLKEFLNKYQIPQEHIEVIERAKNMLDDELPDDLREATLKIISLAIADNGKVRQRAKTFVKKLKMRVGDIPIVKMLEELINSSNPNDAIIRISDVIAKEKYTNKIESLENEIDSLRKALTEKEAEKNKILADARQRIERLNKRIEQLEKEKERLTQEKNAQMQEKVKKLNLELEEINIELNSLRELGKRANDLNLLKDLDELDIKIDNLKRKREKRIDIDEIKF